MRPPLDPTLLGRIFGALFMPGGYIVPERRENIMRSDDEGPPDPSSAHLERGWELVDRGDLVGALRAAERSLELEGDNPEAHNLIGYVHMLEGQGELALEHFQQALDLDEFYLDAMINAAEVMVHQLHDYEGAVKMVDDALELCEGTDETTDVMLLEVDAYLGAGDMKSAEAAIARLPSGPYEVPHLPFEVARVRFEIGDVDGAEPLLREAIVRQPQHGDAHYYLGLILDQRGKPAEATLQFLRARECEVRGPKPHWSLGPEHFERRVQTALRRLAQSLSATLEGALVVAADMPGVEVVADGVDPHVTVLVDDTPVEEGGPQGLTRLRVPAQRGAVRGRAGEHRERDRERARA